MPSPSKKVRLDLFNNLKSNPAIFQKYSERGSLMDFLSKIWDLRLLPSTDPRFQDAHGDIYQHMVNNDDWSYDFLFLEYLKLLDAPDDIYKNFLEALVSPDIRAGEDEIFRTVLMINDHIDKDGLILAVDDYTDTELPIHRLQSKSLFGHAPTDLKKNSINFFVEQNKSGYADRFGSHTIPSSFPAFVLVLDDSWNDWYKRTSFELFFYDAPTTGIRVGSLKIAYYDYDAVTNHSNVLLDILPKTFTELSEQFCSLGTSESYYTTLRRILKRDFEPVLFSLRDLAFFPEIKENFETNPLLKNSLFRFEEQERIARQIRYKIYGYDLSNLYKFKYFFKPQYSNTPVDVSIDFSGDGDFPSRIFALIGKNGAGKTQLISSLPLHISKREDKLFSPRAPLFSRVIAVSYSIFDRFEIPRRSSSFNYVYCGLRNEQGEIMTERGQTQRFHNTSKKIQSIGRLQRWRDLLTIFLDQSLVDEMIVAEDGEPLHIPEAKINYKINTSGIASVRKKLSSGQNIMLSIVSEILANIMYDSLILFDEPETHLHPNAVSQLVNTIYELVNEFQSFCLIATHSPLVIRELLSKNVLVIERHEDEASIRRVGMESFGENLSVLTEDVFGNREVPKHYKSVIKNLVDSGYSFEEVIAILQSEGSPLGLNARIYIKSLLS